VDPASVLAIGDGANDVAMFEVAGTGVAMGNAAPEVQSAATFVTGRSADGGWASALVDRVLAAPTS
jgi:hydroxymethylpyrimidine pyrophosphatase-like HAD family hydrolase